MKVSARGIYSTGLLSLLKELNYELTNLSEEQSKRFQIFNKEKEDISIFDLKDKSGVVIIGKNSEELINKLKNILWDSFFYKNKSEEKYYVNLGYNSKIILDEYRNKIIPTIKNHHVYRRTLSDILNFSEILINYVEEERIQKSIKEFIVKKLKERGYVKRYHRKPITNVLIKYIEVIKEVKLLDNKIYLETIRLINSDGLYDGLNIKKEKGDYAITKYIENEWYFVIEYYSKDGELKGKYININTPLEITTKIFYNDLCIDIVESKEKKIVDKEELDFLYNQNIISEKLYKKALEICDILMKNGK
ncbi:MAG: DUF402 domain-containing protein [Nanopusillaceae archaeon]